jgi:hypothetical protein
VTEGNECAAQDTSAHTHTHTRRQLSEFKRQAHFNEVNFKFTLDIVFYSTRWGKSTEIRMERTSENSSFIQLEGMHYLSCFPFFLPAKCMQAAAAAHATNAHATNAHATNAHAFFLFFISRQTHARRRTRNATNACRRCAAAA